MPSIFSSDRDLLIYYGRGGAERLAHYRRVALQVGLHDEEELARIQQAGTRALAYLSLGEDLGPPGPWQREERNPLWGGRYVIVDHPGWRERLRAAAAAAFDLGFAGLFLDTVDSAAAATDGAAATAALVASLRRLAGDRPILANRGFQVAARLAPLVDGFVFEAFSTTWCDGYRALEAHQLGCNDRLLAALRRFERPVFAIDYADGLTVARFARARASSHGLPCQVADRWLLQIP